jgi:hypothetical protein
VTSLTLAEHRRAAPWRPVAFLIFGIGWGASQFTSLLGVYRHQMHLPEKTTDCLFAAYAIGLVPGLVLGAMGASRFGRRQLVCPFAAVSAAVSMILMAGVSMPALLLAGRLSAGVVAGLVLAVGSAWIKDLSGAPHDPAATPGAGARRAALAVSAGLGIGPLAAAIVAQWSPAPLVTAYLPHLLVMAVAIPVAWRVPETSPARRRAATAPGGSPGPGTDAAAARAERLRCRTGPLLRVIVPAAPWVFAAPTVAFAVLPGVVVVRQLPVLYAGAITCLTLLSGVLVQPLARRLDARRPQLVASAGLTATIAGLVVAAITAATGRPLLAVIAAVILGCGHGLCLVFGLGEVARRAGPGRLVTLTAVFYGLAYAGMFAPYVLAVLGEFASLPILLGGGSLLASCSLAAVTAWA